jgi:putative hydrolase of the HAD superfamily
MPVDALILDFGEVLVHAQSAEAIARMAQLVHLSAEEFQTRYWSHRVAYDSGLPAADYWRRVLQGLDPAPDDLDPIVADLIAADYDSWTVYRPDVWEIARAFKAAAGRTAILSNGVPEIMSRLQRERSLAEFFDVIVVSYEVGCAKPDPAIYRICLERLNVPAEAALFVDDRVENLEAASALGIQTLHFTGDRSVEELRDRVALRAPGTSRVPSA